MTDVAPAIPLQLAGTPAFHRLRVSQVGALTDDAVEVAFEVPSGLREAFAFEHGQHLTLRLQLGGDELRRTYSITSVVGDPVLRIGVKRVPGGAASTWLTTELVQGDELDVMTPAGRFTTPLRPRAAHHWLLVAAGSGITPIMSIMRSALAAEPESRVTLLYCNRTSRSIMFREQLEDLKDQHLPRVQLMYFLTRERRGIDLFDGRLTAQRMRRVCATLVDPHSVDHAFLCGPEAMSGELSALLVGLGVCETNVHVELFGTDLPVVPQVVVHDDSAVVCQASVRVRGLESRVDVHEGERLLNAARRAGLDVPFACTGGVCSTCRAHVSGGEIEMVTNHALDPAEVAAGFALTCQSLPRSPQLLVDYDHR